MQCYQLRAGKLFAITENPLRASSNIEGASEGSWLSIGGEAWLIIGGLEYLGASPHLCAATGVWTVDSAIMSAILYVCEQLIQPFCMCVES